MQQLMGKYEEVSRRLANVGSAAPDVPAPAEPGNSRSTTRMPNDLDTADEPGSPIPDYWSFETEPGPPTPRYRISNIASPWKVPLTGAFGPGFQFQTDDEEFQLQIHVLSQTEARIWGQGDQAPANNGFFFPRQRFFFNCRITRPVEYVFLINRGLNSLDLLDAFINYHPDSRFQVRIGR
jgi:phosphate-selective porin OprO/OprP